MTNELLLNKTNDLGFATSENTDQSGHMPSLHCLHDES